MLSSTFSRNALKITRGILGPLDTNCYLVGLDKHCLIIDPSDSADVLVNWVEKNCPKTKTEILLTHGHFDHIGAVPDLCKALPNVTLYGCEKDYEFFTTPELNLSTRSNKLLSIYDQMKYMKWVKHEDKLRFDDVEFEVLGLPGHTPGSIGFYSAKNNALFSGDTLFQGSIGNTDLPRAHYDTMMASIRDRLLTLPDKTEVFPGHGDPTTIGDELKSNPFLGKVKNEI